MKCFNPYFSRIYQVPFPCGKCKACRMAKKMEWVTRLNLEGLAHSDIAFVTLTYAPEHVPSDYSLNPHHLTLFLKRLRRSLSYHGFKDKIRYYAVGEYGEKRQRPHYHLILFGLPQRFFHFVTDCWGKGRVDCQVPLVRESVARYVSGYVLKKFNKLYYGKRTSPFSRQSQGLGRDFVDSLKGYVDYILEGSYKRPLGRYLKHRLAKRFGVLEAVKAQGMKYLQDFVHDVYAKSSLVLGFTDITDPPVSFQEALNSVNYSQKAEIERRFNSHKERLDL